MSVDVRLLTPGEDLGPELDLSQRAFGPFGSGEREGRLAAVRDSAGAGHHIGAFDSGVLVGSARWLDTQQWWVGQSLPMAAVASVKVAPEHQGRGIGRAVMTGLLQEVAAQGYALSALYPVTNSLYRSVGWEMAGGQYDVTVPARSLFGMLAPDPVTGGDGGPDGGPVASPGSGSWVRRGGPADAAKIIAVQSELDAASRGCGPMTYDAPTLARTLDNPDLYCYLAPDGVLTYRWNRSDDEMLASYMAAGSAATARALWSILASHGTMVSRVRAFVSPADPVTWLVREPDVTLTRRRAWMLRLVDAPAAIAGRGFPAGLDLRVALSVQDAQLPANSGTWLLEIAGGKAALTRDDPASSGVTRAEGPLRLGARGLAALYAGTPLATLRIAGLVAGGLSETDAMLDDAFACTAYMLDYF